MACQSRTLRVTTITFNGINHTPLNKTAMAKLGGDIADGTVMDNAGKSYSSTKVEPGEVEFEIPLNADFDPGNYRNQCGDIMFLTSEGKSYLMTNAQHKGNLEIKDSEGKVKLSFIGDAMVVL